MQAINVESQRPIEQYHTRLWWMEILRGMISTSLGILLIFLTKFTFTLLIHFLGVYLLIDGCADIYRYITLKQKMKHKFANSLFGIISLALGFSSFVFSFAPLLLIAAVVGVRIVTRGVRVIIDARQSHDKYTGFIWLLGMLFLLSGVALLLMTTSLWDFTLSLISLFLIIYVLCDGFYMLIRGLVLRFRPSLFTAALAKVPESLLDLPETFPNTTRRAIIFVRHPGANGLGHVSWAFEWTNGWFNTGSVENEVNKPYSMPQEMGFWSAHTLDPVQTTQKQYKTYDEYKIFYVTQPHPKDAWGTVIWESRQPYVILHHNCVDVAYDVLRAYGVAELIDPVEGLPNDWYDMLPARSYKIEGNTKIPIHLHKISRRELATKEIKLTIPASIKATPPPWHVDEWRIWQEVNFTIEKMLRDVQTLFVSVRHRVALVLNTRE